MKIHVRWSDIRSGRRGRTAECMVALALKRDLGVDYVSVGYEGGAVVAGGELRALYLPLAVRNKIKFWDRFHFVLPFSFELATSGFLTGARLPQPELPPSISGRPSFAEVWAAA